MKPTIKLGRIFGIEIGAHISWIIIFILVLFSLVSYFSVTQPQWLLLTQWVAAILSALLFFISVITHELGHSLMAQHYGIEVRSITLFLFGGVSQLQAETKRPKEEFWIAIFGPLTSLALAGLFSFIGTLASANTLIVAVATWLTSINFALAIFNMLPGLPLDGGHVLKGFIWWVTGNPKQANQIASASGQIVAMLMILTGITIFFETQGNFSGFWLVFLGWFLLDAARANFQENSTADILKSVTVADLMVKDCPKIDANISLLQFVKEHLLRTGRRFFIVTNDGKFIGIITASDLQGIKTEMWPFRTVGDVMHPFDQFLWVSPDTTAYKALETMNTKEVNQLPIMLNGEVLGLVTRQHFMQLLAMHMEFPQNSEEIVVNHHLMKPI